MKASNTNSQITKRQRLGLIVLSARGLRRELAAVITKDINGIGNRTADTSTGSSSSKMDVARLKRHQTHHAGPRVKDVKTLLIALAAVTSFATCLAQTYAPDLDLSKAKSSEIIKVAQSEAKEFYQQHKGDAQALSDANMYASGRAIKHAITTTDQEIEYERAFISVLTQMELDKE